METVGALLRPNIIASAGLKTNVNKQENVIKPTSTSAISTLSLTSTTPHKIQHTVQNNNSSSLEQATGGCDEVDENKQDTKFNAKDFELLTKEYQEQKSRTRKLQQEIDEKNDIINLLREELETSKEESDKYQKENLQLVKDAKRAKDLQDELDCLHSRMGNVEQLELENKRLKDKFEEKVKELEYFNIRVGELEKDRNEAQEESQNFEEQCKRAETKLAKIDELEKEVQKWKSFSHELEAERNSIQGKLLESIEQENKLNSINEKVEDEVKRLRSLIRSYEEEKSINTINGNNNDLNGSLSDTNNQSSLQDTSIKFELDKHIELELNEENRGLKQKLNEKESELREAFDANKEIRDELEGNRKLISDLRQDLACEKSLAQKLTKQLANFTRQIRHLDKQYFPIHDDESGSKQRHEQYKSSEADSPRIERAEEPQSDREELAPKEASARPSEDGKDEGSIGSGERDESKSSKSEVASEGQVVVARADKDQEHLGALVAVSQSQSQSPMQLGGFVDRVPHERLTVGLMLHQQHSSSTTAAASAGGGSCTGNKIADYPAKNQQPPATPAPTSSGLAVTVASVVGQQQVGGRATPQPLMVNRAADLTEKQIAHLTSLHHQHYYHHLQHMHQLHQMHHLHLHHHRLHHEYQHQHQPTCSVSSPAASSVSSPSKSHSAQLGSSSQTSRSGLMTAVAESSRPQLGGPAQEPMYSGGSQFYASAVQQLSSRQLYANTANGGGELSAKHSHPHLHLHPHPHPHPPHQHQHQHQHQHHPHDHIHNNQTQTQTKAQALTDKNKLVSNSNSDNSSSSNNRSLRSSPMRQHSARLSPQKMSAHHHNSPTASYGLPQIDEVNGLAGVDGLNLINKQQSADAQLASSAAAAQRRQVEALKHNSNGLPSSASPPSSSSSSSPSSSSPTSSGSSRRSPVSSSSSSLSSLSPSSSLPLNRGGALRHTTTNVSRRQYSVERDLAIGNMPMTATLSRTGSCRSNNIRPAQGHSVDHQLQLQHQSQLNNSSNIEALLQTTSANYVQMRTPLKSQQPSMRTSKILNISQQQPQQPQQLSPGQVHQMQQQQHLHLEQQQRTQNGPMNLVSPQKGQNNKGGLSAAKSSMERFTSNLANIRLKDSLAFASLRVPKKSSTAALNGVNHNDSHTSNGQPSSAASAKLTAHLAAAALARNSPERRRQANNAAATTNDDNNNIKSNTSNSSNKSSSVFFEYGCV